MVGAEVKVMLDGWCNVFHHSTEYLITGKLNKPIIAIIEDILFQLPDSSITKIKLDKKMVRDKLANISEDEDLRRYIL